MARITVEDCIDKFPSRFELVLVASNRARKLHSGETPTLEIDNDKNTVIALREIAEQTITTEKLKNDLIEEFQTNTFSEDEDINEIEDNSDDNDSQTEEVEVDADPQSIGNNYETIEETHLEASEDKNSNSSDEDEVIES